MVNQGPIFSGLINAVFLRDDAGILGVDTGFLGIRHGVR